jgi:hypothetical protein
MVLTKVIVVEVARAPPRERATLFISSRETRVQLLFIDDFVVMLLLGYMYVSLKVY